MDSGTLKIEALCWLRFVKHMELVATEAGSWNADVLGIGKNHSIELEVKVSKADLRREFETKRTKHFLYNSSGERPSGSVPNYFYFYVPQDLEEEALRLIKEHSPKAGLAVYEDRKVMDGRRTSIVKRPTKLHDKPPTAGERRAVLLRMGSELCARYVKEREQTQAMGTFMRELEAKVMDKVTALADTPSFTGDEDADQPRGQENEPSTGPSPVPGPGVG